MNINTIPLPSAYEYRAEGNLHLALSVIDKKKIILIRKRLPKDKESWVTGLLFYNHVMCYILQPFVCGISNVIISSQQLKEIENKILPHRPLYRQDRKQLADNAAAIPDYTQFQKLPHDEACTPTFSFEIKPKCAVDINGVCKFCAKQAQKLSSGRIKRITKYCPKNLFSGDEQRMHSAIESLLENPQNNISIYKDSILSYSEDSNPGEIPALFKCWKNTHVKIDEDYICNLLLRILTFPYEEDNCSNCSKTRKYTILERIKQLQSLDSRSTTNHCLPEGYVKSLLDKCKNPAHLGQLCAECKIKNMALEESEQHYLSKIARDCSIILTVKKQRKMSGVYSPNIRRISIKGEDFIFTTHVIDLFPKDEK